MAIQQIVRNKQQYEYPYQKGFLGRLLSHVIPKWLDFGCTRDGSSLDLQRHLGCFWMKLGYSETIPWSKVGKGLW